MKKLGACLLTLMLVVGSTMVGLGSQVSVSSETVTCGENQYQVPKVIPDPRRSVEVICVDNVDITGNV